jgi:hypothetical protein
MSVEALNDLTALLDRRLDACVDRRGAGKVGRRITIALPIHGPAARLLAEMVGAVPGHQHSGVRI